MDCNEELHILLKDNGDIYCFSCNNRINCDDRYHIEIKDTICPFCDDDDDDDENKDDTPKLETCCENKDIVDHDGAYVCKSCGTVEGYKLTVGYIDYHENRYKLRRKSVYHRKYHLEKFLMLFELSYENRIDFRKSFKQMESAINKLQSKKRYPFIKYLCYKIFQLKNDNNNIKRCKRLINKRTLLKYNKLCIKVCEILNWKYIETDNGFFT